jgi:hypothetical protein
MKPGACFKFYFCMCVMRADASSWFGLSEMLVSGNRSFRMAEKSATSLISNLGKLESLSACIKTASSSFTSALLLLAVLPL